MSAINPRIVYAQIKGFAPDGTYANFLAFDTHDEKTPPRLLPVTATLSVKVK